MVEDSRLHIESSYVAEAEEESLVLWFDCGAE